MEDKDILHDLVEDNKDKITILVEGSIVMIFSLPIILFILSQLSEIFRLIE